MEPRELVTALRAAGCVYAEDEAAVLTRTAGSDDELLSLLARRVAGEPLEVVVGWTEFCGLQIHGAAGVFVPRRRSALVVAAGLDGLAADAVVLDLCCGTGAISAALLACRPGLDLLACDSDAAATHCAITNLGGQRVRRGQLFDAVPASRAGRVDLVVAVAPYVPTAAIRLLPPEARLYEPRHALDGGHDGMDLQRSIIAAAPTWLAPGGRLILESSSGQATSLEAFMKAAGLDAVLRSDDDLGAVVAIGTARSAAR